MSDTPPTAGWWQASDGRWYPPELHPAAPSAPPAASSSPPGPGYWRASDGNWYPPEVHPYYVPPPQPPARPPGTPPTNRAAIASFVLGAVGFTLLGIGCVLPLRFGYLALGQIDRSEGAQGGRGLARAGIVLGYLQLALIIGVILFTFSGRAGATARPTGPPGAVERRNCDETALCRTARAATPTRWCRAAST